MEIQGLLLKSYDYETVAKDIAPQLVALLRTAKEGMCVPPLEILITGADDDAIMHCEMNVDGKLVKNYLPEDQKLRARFPLTVTMTHKGGNSWETTLDKKKLQ